MTEQSQWLTLWLCFVIDIVCVCSVSSSSFPIEGASIGTVDRFWSEFEHYWEQQVVKATMPRVVLTTGDNCGPTIRCLPLRSLTTMIAMHFIEGSTQVISCVPKQGCRTDKQNDPLVDYCWSAGSSKPVRVNAKVLRQYGGESKRTTLWNNVRTRWRRQPFPLPLPLSASYFKKLNQTSWKKLNIICFVVCSTIELNFNYNFNNCSN